MYVGTLTCAMLHCTILYMYLYQKETDLLVMYIFKSEKNMFMLPDLVINNKLCEI